MANLTDSVPLAPGTPTAVLAAAQALFDRHFPGHSPALCGRLVARIEELFAGRYPGYQACDTKFHDLTHTCDAALAVVHLLDGQLRSGEAPRFQPRDTEVALAAILLHDTGYLKATGDPDGTGAKYTRTHVERGAQLAVPFLNGFGFSAVEIRCAQRAIRSTGLYVDTTTLGFANDREQLIGFMLGTGDMLGQLASATYPGRLPALYDELQEGGTLHHGSPRQLMRQTRRFVEQDVRQMLAVQWGGVDRYLGEMRDLYFRSITANLVEIDRQLVLHH